MMADEGLTYSVNSFECKSEYLLFDTEIVVRAFPRGFFRPRLNAERCFALAELAPTAARGEYRRIGYIGPGLFMLIFSAIACRGLRYTFWSLPVILIVFAMGILLIRAAIRPVVFADFQKQGGVPAFRIYFYGRNRLAFENFVTALANRIPTKKKNGFIS